MQVPARRVAMHLLQPSRRAGVARAMLAQQRQSSFIKQVMEQVKRDMENDPKMKKDWEQAQKTSQRMAQKSATFEGRLGDVGERFSDIGSRTAEALRNTKESVQTGTSKVTSKWTEATEQNESLKKATESMKSASETVGSASSTVLSSARSTFNGVMDSSSKVFGWVGDADKKAERTKNWKETRHSMKAHMDAKAAAEAEAVAKTKAESADGVDSATSGEKEEMKSPGAGETTASATTTPPEQEQASALVVSEAKSSSWDRFGAGLRDMPFLSSVFENPLFDRIFGESEIAASIREMKEMDYSFRLDEFAEDVEEIVAPHIIRTYLEGDQEALQKHCGDAAFAAVNASIKARLEQKLSLDPSILAGPKEMNLVSAKLNDKGPPSFIWTFQMQQVNCLRDAEGEIIEGAEDDIRTVCYAIAIERHPNVDKELDLEYPWQISELAILWNQPCF